MEMAKTMVMTMRMAMLCPTLTTVLMLPVYAQCYCVVSCARERRGFHSVSYMEAKVCAAHALVGGAQSNRQATKPTARRTGACGTLEKGKPEVSPQLCLTMPVHRPQRLPRNQLWCAPLRAPLRATRGSTIVPATLSTTPFPAEIVAHRAGNPAGQLW